MIASRASKTIALTSLVALGLLTGMTPAVGTETLTTTPAPTEATGTTPAPAEEDPVTAPTAPVNEPTPLPSATPAPSSTEAPTAADYRNNPDLLASLIGDHGASMGQGLERLEATGDAQKQLSQEASSLSESGARADSPDSVSGAAMAPSATNYWQPSSGVLGVDVSSHQGQYVNWNGAWDYGSRYAYVKATEALSYKNPFFGTQYTQSGNSGMLRGAYHFAIPNISSGAQQANYFFANGGGWSADGKTLPPLLDVEYNPYPELGNTCYNMSASQMVNWIRDFSNRMVTLTDRKPMIYTTTDWWSQCTGNSAAFSDHALHIASYNKYGAGVLPASWGHYSIWQYTDSGPVVGDWNQWNGSLPSLQSFARGGSAPTAVSPKPSVRSLADMVAIDSSGLLWNYPADGEGGFGTRFQIGNGWSSAESINPVDWNADGTIDLLAQWDNGTLNYYPGKPTGGFSSAVQIGNGWQGISIAVGPWVKGQGITVVGARPDGALDYWPHTATHRLGSRVRIGTGFNSMPIVMADQNLDGRMDLLTRDANNNLLRYTGSGTGTIVSESRAIVGHGWDIIDAVNAVDGFNGTASRGIIGRTTTGNLTYYPFTTNGFGSATTVGNGWSNYTIAGTDFGEVTAESDLVASGPPSVRSLADMVAIDSSGKLWNYPANGSGGFGSRIQIGSEWSSAKSINTVDWNADGTIDILAQWTNGTLNYYPGRSAGGFSSPIQIGSAGWEDISLAVGPWITGQGPTIVGAAADGTLYYWPHTSSHRLGSRVKIGTGFNGMPIVMADQNRDGNMDLLYRDDNNNLMRYTASGTGTIAAGSRAMVGNGWDIIDAINPVDGFNGNTSRGLIGRKTNGDLIYYPFTADGFGSAKTVGSGWSTYTISGTDFKH